jgi:DNA-binding NarL/FixJ family response regulator
MWPVANRTMIAPNNSNSSICGILLCAVSGALLRVSHCGPSALPLLPFRASPRRLLPAAPPAMLRRTTRKLPAQVVLAARRPPYHMSSTHASGGDALAHRMSVRALVAAGEPLVRLGILAALRSAADIAVLGEAADNLEALTVATAVRSDVTLVDAMLPGGAGPAAALLKTRCSTRVLLLARDASLARLRAAAEVGVDGYVLRDILPADLVAAVRAVHRVSTIYSPRTRAREPVQAVAICTRTGPRGGRALTDREVEVLTAVVVGLTDKEIAARLFLSEATVRTHLRALYRRSTATRGPKRRHLRSSMASCRSRAAAPHPRGRHHGSRRTLPGRRIENARPGATRVVRRTPGD